MENARDYAENEYAGTKSDGKREKEDVDDETFIKLMGKHLIKTEDMKDFIYLDKYGHITTGIGSMLDKKELFESIKWEINGRLATNEEINKAYKIFKSLQEEKDEKGKPKYHNYRADYFKQFSNLRVSEDTMINAMHKHLAEDLKHLRKWCKDFNLLPLAMKFILMDFCYNKGNITRQKGILVALNSKNYHDFKRAIIRNMPKRDAWTLEQLNQIPKSFWKN